MMSKLDEQLVHFTRRTSGFLVNIATVGKRGHYGVAVWWSPAAEGSSTSTTVLWCPGGLNQKKYRNMEWLCCPNHWGINMGYSTFWFFHACFTCQVFFLGGEHDDEPVYNYRVAYVQTSDTHFLLVKDYALNTVPMNMWWGLSFSQQDTQEDQSQNQRPSSLRRFLTKYSWIDQPHSWIREHEHYIVILYMVYWYYFYY